MMAGFGLAMYRLERGNRFRQIDSELETRVTALSRELRQTYRDAPGGRRGPPPEGRRGPPPEGRRGPRPGGRRGPPPDGPPPDGPPPRDPRRAQPVTFTLSPQVAALFGPSDYYVIWYRGGNVITRSPNAPAGESMPPQEERDTLAHFKTTNENREAVHCSGLGDCAVAGRSISAEIAATRGFGWRLAGAGALLLIAGFGVGFWLIGRAIRPLESIGHTARRIAAGDFSARVEVTRRDDELGRLSGVLNTTFAQLEAAFERQQQFTSDAAHELRTPLSILIAESQTTLSRERTAEEYRETVEGNLDTAQQMRSVTDALLELARFDTTGSGVIRDAVDLCDVAARAVKMLEAQAATRGITTITELDTARAWAVPERVDMVAANLLGNAISYNREGGEIRVRTRVERDAAVLEVSDTGIGIASADIPRIFDRFYRADKARSRSQGHAGLGLAICKAIVEAEGGSIEAKSRVGEGSVFTVRFRLSGVVPMG
jgi:signal transduction histidine kinase